MSDIEVPAHRRAVFTRSGKGEAIEPGTPPSPPAPPKEAAKAAPAPKAGAAKD